MCERLILFVAPQMQKQRGNAKYTNKLTGVDVNMVRPEHPPHAPLPGTMPSGDMVTGLLFKP